jgi:hypothetical protein
MLFSVLSKNLVVAVFLLYFSKLSSILISSFGHVPMAHLDGGTVLVKFRKWEIRVVLERVCFKVNSADYSRFRYQISLLMSAIELIQIISAIFV